MIRTLKSKEIELMRQSGKILAGDFGGEYGIFIMMEANNNQ